MREFENLHRQIRQLVPGPRGGFELQGQIGDTVAELGVLARERVGFDFAEQAQVEEPILLFAQQRQIALNLLCALTRLTLLILRPQPQHLREPVAHPFVLEDALEDLHDLLIDVRFSQTDRWMTDRFVHGAAIVDVFLARLLFHHRFTGNEIVAVPAADQSASVRQFMRFVGMPAKERLNAIPDVASNNRLLTAGIPLAFEADFRDVGTVPKNVVDFGAAPGGSVIRVFDVAVGEALDHAIDRGVLIGVKVKDQPNIVCLLLVHHHDAAAIDALVLVPVWCQILDYALWLSKQVTPADAAAWSRGTPEDWANESHRVAVDQVYRDVPADRAPPKLDVVYVHRAKPVVEQQLERGGVRLATILNRALGD